MNRHPVDQLAEIRTAIKSLQEQESNLKQTICDMLPEKLERGETQTITGDDYVASIYFVERETLDRKAVENLLTKHQLEECLKMSSNITVRTTYRTKDVS